MRPFEPGDGRRTQPVPFHCSATVPSELLPELSRTPPTAVQAVADAHDTPARRLIGAPAGDGTGWMLQLVPFHLSARVPALDTPTAKQADTAGIHATLVKKPPPCAGLGAGWMFQLVPFHPSARVPAFEAPTAVQADADVQDTPFKEPPPCGGLGVAWIVHLVPFHRSATARDTPAVVMLDPTAVQAEADVQATPSKPLNAIPDGLGVGRMRHEVPFHCSARLTPMPEALTYVPTAMHEFAAGQDTQNNWPVGTRGFGLGVIDHPPAGPLAGAAEAPIRMVAAAVARQTAARPATAGTAAPRARCSSIPDGRGRRFPASLISWCRDRAATQPVLELTPRMMTPQMRRIVAGSPTPGRSQKAHIAGQGTFSPAVVARARACLTGPGGRGM